MEKCRICGLEHDNKCVLVKAVEFYKNGKIKRIEYLTPSDLPSVPRIHSFEPHGTTQ